MSRDTDGNEYTTFREDIGERAKRVQGKRVRLGYHEERRGQYTNAYLDKIEPVQAPVSSGAGAQEKPRPSRLEVPLVPEVPSAQNSLNCTI